MMATDRSFNGGDELNRMIMRFRFQRGIEIFLFAVIAALAAWAYFVEFPALQVRALPSKMQMARTLESDYKWAEAAEMYESILAITDSPARAYHSEAAVRVSDIYRRRTFELDKARSALRKAAEFSDSYAESARKDLDFLDKHWGENGAALNIWYNASNAFRRGDDTASLDLLKVLTLDPATSLRPLAMIRMAKILEKMSRHNDAARQWRQYLAEYPGDEYDTEARQILKRLGSGSDTAARRRHRP